MDIIEKKDKKILKKFWNFVWHDDSLLGWITSLIVIFLIVKFIFFPILFLLTGTSLPLVVVESCSMYHGNNFNDWWTDQSSKYEQFNIDKEKFKSFPMKNGFNKGDIIFAIGANTEKIDIGKIIIFNANQRHPIIHRAVTKQGEGNTGIVSTLGDSKNNPKQHPFEKSIADNQIIGEAVFKIPYVGWIKLFFFEAIKSIDGNPDTHFQGRC
jgi:signal peptidase I